MTDLGPEWVPDSEGVPSRSAARLVIFDEVGNVLLVHGRDTHDLNHHWWFTVGGGLEEGEEPAVGAVREAWEETGFIFDPASLEGPVLFRSAQFEFRNVTARQSEQFFIARMVGVRPELGIQRLTAVESETLDDFRWFSASELEQMCEHEAVYPEQFPALVRRWAREWDGSVVHLTPAGTWTWETWSARSQGPSSEPVD